MRYLELFAGAGGMSHGLERAGWQCVAHAEIEPHARAVLRAHWPGVPLLGDVRTIDGAQFRGRVDFITGGSPCQGMSVAGKGEGLADERSVLFYEQVRIWRESGAPYLLWENVRGALSSNSGEDFATVLSCITGAAVAVPRVGRERRWLSAGRAMGPAAVAAWRVFDLQHFGPPQRRARVFIVAARTGDIDPAEVLALTEGVCRHPSPREQAREAVTGTLSARTRGGGGLGTDFDLQGGVVTYAFGSHTGTAEGGATNRSHANGGPVGFGLTIEHTNTLRAGRTVSVCSVDTDREAVIQTLTDGGRSHGAGDSYDNTPVVVSVLGDVTHTLTHEGADASEDGTGRGTPIVLAHGQANAEIGVGVSPTLSLLHEAPIAFVGRPRRITPREAERLMSWPDDWTRFGVREDGVRYELKDTPRYRLCGNGVGSDCAEWIARRITNAPQRAAKAAA